MIVTVFVHEVNGIAHPSAAGSWRWAVHVGSSPENLDECVNAWGEGSQSEAAFRGDTAAVAAVGALRKAGVDAQYGGVKFLEFDPIPAGADLVKVMG